MEKNEEKVDVGEELEEPEEILGDDGTDTTDWKAETFKRHGMAKRYKSDAQKAREDLAEYKTAHPDKPIEEPKPQDKTEFGLAEESFLLAKGVKESNFPLVLEEVKKTGKSIKEILNSKYFQEELEKATSAEATPGKPERVGGAGQNEVDYWVQKGVLPPNTPENTELRRKVAKERAKQAENKQKFSSQPIVG